MAIHASGAIMVAGQRWQLSGGNGGKRGNDGSGTSGGRLSRADADPELKTA